ncbi:MAG: hypothetical protein OEY77_02055 [Nitrospira sp.]|nr:hypothetical protein [Nitrospira sp.]
MHSRIAHGATVRPTCYTPATVGKPCSPSNAKQVASDDAPGETMPPVEGCAKQDYALLIVIGMNMDNWTPVPH